MKRDVDCVDFVHLYENDLEVERAKQEALADHPNPLEAFGTRLKLAKYKKAMTIGFIAVERGDSQLSDFVSDELKKLNISFEGPMGFVRLVVVEPSRSKTQSRRYRELREYVN